MFELLSELHNIIMITDNQALRERDIDIQTNIQTGYRENSTTIIAKLLRYASGAGLLAKSHPQIQPSQ